MNLFKMSILISLLLMIVGCGEVFYCRNPSSVALVEHLPCTNCEFKGTVKSDFCPDGTYPHKLQCLAEKRGANVILLKQLNKDANPRYPAYACPAMNTHSAPRNDKTDVSNSCSSC